MENNEFKIENSDIIVDCFEKMAGGAQNLVQYLVQGNGKMLFEKIVDALGIENTKKLYDDNVTIERLMLSTQAIELKSEKQQLAPKM